MKQSILLTLFIAASAFQVNAQKKVPYVFPKEMAPAIKAEFQKQCDKGQMLYNINCAKCHNTIENGKTIVPDFTPDQLKGYEIRVQNPKHENSLPDEQVTTEELGDIMTFLLYKKKNK